MASTAKPKGVRLGALVQQVDLVWKDVLTSAKPAHPDNVDALKNACGKLHEVLSTKEKCCKVGDTLQGSPWMSRKMLAT